MSPWEQRDARLAAIHVHGYCWVCVFVLLVLDFSDPEPHNKNKCPERTLVLRLCTKWESTLCRSHLLWQGSMLRYSAVKAPEPMEISQTLVVDVHAVPGSPALGTAADFTQCLREVSFGVSKTWAWCCVCRSLCLCSSVRCFERV